MNERKTHEALSRLQHDEGMLLIGGKRLDVLVREKQLPCYLYDSEAVASRIAELKMALPDNVHLHYAVKANPMPELVRFVADRVDGLDVASDGELRIALESGMHPGSISFAGPGKRQDELEKAVAAGVVINAESERELARLSQIARNMQRRVSVAVRVNPAFELKSSGMKMGGGSKPFGIDEERLAEVFAGWDSEWMTFAGLHIFWGSQNLNPAAIVEAQRGAFNLALRFTGQMPEPPRFINLGGGFGIPYFPGEASLDMRPIHANLSELSDELKKTWPEAVLVIELGRYLVGEAGYYVCEVLDKKVSRGETYLIASGGMHHHLAASGNFGQVIRKNYPVVVANRMRSGVSECVNVVGPCCTPLDILASKMELPVAEVGDWIVVLQSGAYGLTASPGEWLL
jgi:diaminopimelate decarboxylase